MSRGRTGDAFGSALLDWVSGGKLCEVLERDDGHFEDGAGPEGYLTGYHQWPKGQKRAIRHLQGPVADAGCGAGRVALELQRRDVEVVGIDSSPLALRAARSLGLRKTSCLTLDSFTSEVGRFGSILLFGNNFGIFGNPKNATRVLSSWARHAQPGTRVFAESTTPYGGGAPIIDRKYYWRNRQLGRAPGQTKYRIWYRNIIGPWNQWLFVSQLEMREIVRASGWRLLETFSDGAWEPYVVMLERR